MLSHTTALASVGHEGDHASRLTLAPAALPPAGLEFGATIDSPADGSEAVAGQTVVVGGRFVSPASAPTRRASAAGPRPIACGCRWTTARSPRPSARNSTTPRAHGGRTSAGRRRAKHTLHVRAVGDGTPSEVATSTFSVVPDARVEWQVVKRNAPVDAAAWQSATGLADWSFPLDTGAYGSGHQTIVVRLVEQGVETSRDSVRAVFR